MLDTSVRFNDIEATIIDVDRSDCTICDACRVEAECGTCDSCSECESSCETCVESISLTVPELATGQYAVVVRNAFGMSSPTNLSVLNPNDADPDGPSD